MVNFSAIRYLRKVNNCLPCPMKTKKRIMERVKHDVKVFLAEKPDADFQELAERFGLPQQIAACYVDEQNAAELLSALRIKRKILGFVAVTAILVVTMWIGVMAYTIYYNANIANGYFSVTTESMYIDSTEPVWRK